MIQGSAETAGAPTPGPRGHVLLVEDDPVNRALAVLSGTGALEPDRELVPRLEAELDLATKALDAAVSSP
jgi:hypothetical protein